MNRLAFLRRLSLGCAAVVVPPSALEGLLAAPAEAAPVYHALPPATAETFSAGGFLPPIYLKGMIEDGAVRDVIRSGYHRTASPPQ